MKNTIKIIWQIATLYAVLLATESTMDSSCAKFISPLKSAIISDSVCSFEVEACEKVVTVNFKIRYTTENGGIKTVPLGMISRRPFKILTSINFMPNQLTRGATAFAECIDIYGNTTTIIRDGIFLTHKQPIKKIYDVPKKKRYSDRCDELLLSSAETSDIGKAKIIIANDSLKIRVAVRSPLFYTLREKLLSKCGITICFDSKNSKSPYLSKDISIFRFPVSGPATQLIISPEYSDDGRYNLHEKVKSIDFPVSIKKQDFKGFAFDITVPLKEISKTISDSLGFNIIATVFNEKDDLIDISWRQGNETEIYSPYFYGKLFLDRTPFDYYLPVLFLLFFITSALLGKLFIFLHFRFGSNNSLQRFEASEQDEELLKKIQHIIDREITTINFSIENIAAQLSTTTKKVSILIKKSQKISFEKHIINQRMEIVKERLRSSNSSEVAISKACGFSSIDEMEKLFKTRYKTTPYKYRESHRVS